MITTHVLDTSRGRPAAGVPVVLELADGDRWQTVGTGVTDAGGRLTTLASPGPLRLGTYRLRFDTGAYFSAQGTAAFFPRVDVQFLVGDGSAHYHVPLLLSPFGYSTYRGS